MDEIGTIAVNANEGKEEGDRRPPSRPQSFLRRPLYIGTRLSYRLGKGLIGLVGRIAPRLYMRLNLRFLRFYGMHINGTPRYIGVSAFFDELCRIELGDRVVISNHVIFLTHDYSCTTAMHAIGRSPASDIALMRGIKVGNNVFIGMGCILLPNTRIGDNVVLGAGSVVRGIVPGNSVLLGNPAKVVSSIEDYAARCGMALENGLGRWD